MQVGEKVYLSFFIANCSASANCEKWNFSHSLIFDFFFFFHARWNSGLVYWHQHNQSLWNHLLATTLRNKKGRLDNESWLFLVYSSSTCFIYLWYLDQGAYEILHSEKNHKNFNVLFFSLREINVIFHSMVHTYVLILN